MSRRALGWLASFSCLMAVFSFDRLIGLRGLIARHHAGILAPWPEYFCAGLALLTAVFFTFVWLRGHKPNHQEQVR